jgi:putative endonuclease
MIPRPGTRGASAPAAAYIYLLQSRQDGTCYVGWTTEPVRRLVEHNTATSGGYTSQKRPWRLVGVEPQPTMEAAKAYERALKRSPRKLARFKKRVLNRAAVGRPCQGVG